MQHDKENIMVILSSPSGVGKTTLTKKIQQKYKNFKISVSHTTRTPRSNEVDGVDYHFVSKEKYLLTCFALDKLNSITYGQYFFSFAIRYF